MKLRALPFALALLAGCGPHWVVVKQAVPDPFVNQRSYAIAEVSYENLTVGETPEAEWLARKDDKQRESFAQDKADAGREFAAAAAAELAKIGAQVGPPGPGTFIIRPHLTDYEPGNFNGFVNLPTRVHMAAALVGPDGTELDRVMFDAMVAADLAHPSSGQRMRDALQIIGRHLAEYVKSRVMPGAE